MAKKKPEIVNLAKIVESLSAQGKTIAFSLAKLDGLTDGLEMRYPEDKTIQKSVQDLKAIRNEIMATLWPDLD